MNQETWWLTSPFRTPMDSSTLASLQTSCISSLYDIFVLSHGSSASQMMAVYGRLFTSLDRCTYCRSSRLMAWEGGNELNLPCQDAWRPIDRHSCMKHSNRHPETISCHRIRNHLVWLEYRDDASGWTPWLAGYRVVDVNARPISTFRMKASLSEGWPKMLPNLVPKLDWVFNTLPVHGFVPHLINMRFRIYTLTIGTVWKI